MRTNKYILLAATLFGLSSCGNKKGDYDASGTFEATEVIVSSEANGKIMQFNIEEGQLLKADEEVGCIDTLQLYLKKMQLLASGKYTATEIAYMVGYSDPAHFTRAFKRWTGSPPSRYRAILLKPDR